jgi:hypothetical protein
VPKTSLLPDSHVRPSQPVSGGCVFRQSLPTHTVLPRCHSRKPAEPDTRGAQAKHAQDDSGGDGNRLNGFNHDDKVIVVHVTTAE